jgi:hypothetical protein
MRKPKPSKKALKREARARTPKSDTPVQPGTIEVVRETPFGRKYAVIRSNAEAGKGFSGSPELLHMLAKISRDLPNPKESFLIGADRLVESLHRNQELQRRMVTQSQAAAETAWPGFHDLMNLLVEREREFTKALGEIGVGVA